MGNSKAGGRYNANTRAAALTLQGCIAPDDPVERGGTTDGRICNNEVRIVDPATGAVLGIGQDSEILTRGPEVMIGYTDPEETAKAFDRDGFFRTGDLGSVDGEGYITISGRKKDLIIRGGCRGAPRRPQGDRPCMRAIAC